MASHKEVIRLIGDGHLVAEFAEACGRDLFMISAMVNPTVSGTGTQKGRTGTRGASGKSDFAVELTNSDRELKRNNLLTLEKRLGPSGIILSSSVTVSCSVQAGWLRHGERLVGISAFPTLP